MQRGRCCQCERIVKGVTIKGLNQSDGVTQWEYGPGSRWRQQHGGSSIVGISWNSAATLNKFILACDQADTWLTNPATRTAGAFSPNAMLPLSLVNISATDGTETSSVDFVWFCSSVSASQFVTYGGIFGGWSMLYSATLSGGDYLITGNVPPTLEWVDYTTDTANKEYVLHAHWQQAGNVYLKTKTSGETITLAYNASASDVATAFNATADCTACTATGGPWPHRKIEISVTWSASTGDISQMKRDGTYSVTGSTGYSLWDYTVPAPPGLPGWTLVDDSCTFGSTATEPGVGTPPGTNVPGTCVGGSPPTVSRKTDGCAATYDVATGLIETSVGYVFGRDATSPSNLVASSTAVPSHTDEATLPIEIVATGDSDSVGTVISTVTNGKTIESWTPGTPWTRNWQKYNNTTGQYGTFWSEGSYFSYVFPKKAFTGGGTASQVRIGHTSGTVTEYNASEVSSSSYNRSNDHGAFLLFDDQSKWVGNSYELWSDPAINGWWPPAFGVNTLGSEVYLDTTVLKLGAAGGLLQHDDNGLRRGEILGATTSAIFGCSGGAYEAINSTSVRSPSSVAGGSASSYYWQFRAPPAGHNGPSTEWRFVFRGGTTSWLAWNASDATIKSAILAVYPENTTGSVSNVVVNPFTISAATVNTIGVFELGLDILFRGAANATGVSLGFPPQSHFDRPGDVLVEFRNVSPTNEPGLSRWESDGSQTWYRNFGTSLALGSAVRMPRMAWLSGSLVIAYGELCENELP